MRNVQQSEEAVKDARPMLLDEYMRLKEEVEPLQKRLDKVKGLLKDCITKDGPYTDEDRGVVVMIEPRYHIEYDPDALQEAFPRLAEDALKVIVQAGAIQDALLEGVITESELELHGIATKKLHSRALLVKPLKGRAHYD